MLGIQGLQFHVVFKNKTHPKFWNKVSAPRASSGHLTAIQLGGLHYAHMLSRPMPEKLSLGNCSKIVKTQDNSILLTLNKNKCQSQIDK